MESFSSMLEAFETLNARKRKDPESLSEQERSRWKEYRREFEKILFQAEPDPAADTREFLRVPVSLSVRYWTRNELKDRYIPVLGEGGLFVATIDPLPVGSQIELEIVLAQKDISFPVKGQVVWVNESGDPAKRGMGIKFIDLTYEQKRSVYSLVDDSLHQRLLERRRFARVDAKLQVEFVYAEGFFELKTEDLSLGGMFIATEHLVPVGERIRVILHMPGDMPSAKAICEVVRVIDDPAPGRPAGLGVRFVEIEEHSQRTIRDYLGLRVSGRNQQHEMERRRAPRVERQVKLRFQSVDAIGNSLARDVSAGGVFIQTLERPPIGSSIQITLIHPLTLQKLELVGRVVRTVEADSTNPKQVAGVGVSFEEISDEKRVVLQRFLRDFVLMDSSDSYPEEKDNG